MNPVVGGSARFASALGACGFTEKIPELMSCLGDVDPVLRGLSAWALGKLQDNRAIGPLKRAMQVEANSYTKQQMRDALRDLPDF